MESEAKYAVVGTVVLALIAAMVLTVVWLRRAGGPGDTADYKIYFARQSLDGVQLRSDVKMRGIVVGAVTGFRISLWKKGSVEVTVRVDRDAPVRESTKAVVDRQLLTGLASIRLVNATEDSPLLTEKPDAEPYPVIAEGETELEQFSQSISQLAASADESFRRLNQLLTEENRVALTKTLANVERLTATAERGIVGMDQTLAALAIAAIEVQVLGAELSENTTLLAARYDELGRESTVAVRDMRVAVNRMAEDVTKLSSRADKLLATGDAEIAATAHELRVAARSLGAAARRFRDPRAILVGPAAGDMGPGEK